MLKLFRWLTRITVGLAIVSVLALGFIYYLVSRSLPDYNRTHKVRGLDTRVEIVRNEHNVPHIFGDTDSDVFFGLGFAHAQDRLWQMIMLRRIAQGRLSEIFGERTVATDQLLRSLDIYGLAGQAVEFQDNKTKSALKAYSAGVNSWINIVNNESLGRGSPEFLIFRSEIRPWLPADSLAILNLQALDLSVHLEDEVLRQRLHSVLPKERVFDILPAEPEQIPFLPFSAIEGSPNVGQVPTSTNSSGLVTGAIFGDKHGASNAWAIAPERAAAGATILANDPHLSFTAPTVWMLARIELADGGIIGATIPGVPAIILGRSTNIAWGLTYAYVDDQDLYFEKLDPSSSQRYLTPDGYKDFRSRISIVNVAGEQPVSTNLYWTENGPVIDPTHYNIASILPEGHVASLSWTLLMPENTTMTGLLRLMTAKNVDEAMEAGRNVQAPAMNLFAIDRNDIAMQVVGSAPRRNLFHETKGRTPSSGWKYRNRWHGSFPYESLPRIKNPEHGTLANANNRTTSSAFPSHLSHVWGGPKRIERLNSILDGRQVHSSNSVIEAQKDIVSFAARTLVPLMARNLWHTIDTETNDPKQLLRADVLSRLQAWIGEMDQNRPEPLIYAAWVRSTQRLMAKDELGALFSEFEQPNPGFIERSFRNINGASIWCDIVQTPAIEDCDQIALLALDDALAMLTNRYGEDIDGWKWGIAHQAAHEHLAFGESLLFSWLFNIQQSTSGGAHTLNRGVPSGSGEDPFTNVHGPGYRAVYDFSDLDASRFIISTGQSGHVLSRHYDDLGTIWSRGEYILMSLDSELVRSSPVGITVLEPSV